MKVRILIPLLISSFFCEAQIHKKKKIPAGIYLTYEDFEIGKLTSEFKSHQKEYSLWPKGFFKNRDVEFITSDTTIVYKRTDIWGYTDHKGRLIRIFNNNHYRVLCNKGLIIYIVYSPTRISYHFSKTFNDIIYRLTKKHIMSAYADYPDLLQKINSVKKKHWMVWDDNKELFLLNELYLAFFLEQE